MKDKIEKLTQQLVQIDTTGGRSAGAAELYGQFLEDHGFQVKYNEYKEDCINVETRLGPSTGKGIVISGHLDVVPVGNIDDWTHDPFSGKIVDNYLWGRGSVDMKGGTSSLAGVMVELLQHENDLSHQVRLAITAEEETGLLGAREFSKGDIMHNAEHLLIAEPTDLGVAIMEKGIIWANIKSKGKQAHASRPDLGDNAIEGLMKLIPDLYEILPETSLPEVGKSSLNVGTISGGSAPNVVPLLAEMICDYRLTPGVEVEYIYDKIQEILKENERDTMKYSISYKNSAPAVISSNKILGNTLAKNTEKLYGKKPELGGTYYATDGAAFLEGHEASFAIFGPGSTELLHQTNEKLDLKQLDLARRIIVKTILDVQK